MDIVPDYECWAVHVRGVPGRDRMAEPPAQATAGKLHAGTAYCARIQIDARAGPDHAPAGRQDSRWRTQTHGSQ